jgi:hypothetical protein
MSSTPQMAPSSSLAPPPGLAGDMKFVGLFTIIGGALNCLSIIGALIGVPAIIAGLKLREAGDGYAALAAGDPAGLQRSYAGQATFFKIQKIFIIIGLIMLALGIVAGIAMLIFGVVANRSNF